MINNVSEILEQLQSIATALGVKTGVVRNDDKKSKKSKGTLDAAQKKEISEKAKIYSSIFEFKKITNYFAEQQNDQKKTQKFLKNNLEILTDLAIEQKNNLINNRNITERITDSLKSFIGISKKEKGATEDKKESPLKKLLTGAVGIAGLAALGVGIYNVIKSLKEGGKIEVSSILKLVGAITLFVGLFVLAAKSAKSFILASISFGIFSSIVSFILIPLIKSLENLKWDVLLNSLGKISAVMIGLTIVMAVVGGLSRNVMGTILALGSIFAMTYLLGYLGEKLQKLSELPWKEVGVGLLLAVGTIGIFGGLVAAIGLLITSGAGAILGLGLVGVLALTYAIGYVADSIKKFNDVDGNALKLAGEGLLSLGLGLVSFMTGMVGGVAGTVIDKVSSFFKLDILSSIKKFQDLDGDKLKEVGLGLKYMGDGMKSISSNINLDGVIKQIVNLTTPITMLSNALFNYGKTYSNLSQIIDKSGLNKNLSLIVNNDNSIQNAILDMNKQELEVHKQQLAQLELNGEFLKLISERILTISSGGSNFLSSNFGSKSSTSAPIFNTKNNFMENLKMTAMSLEN